MIKWALREEQAFHEFRAEVGTLRLPPRNNPDFELLAALKEFFEGRGSAEDVLRLKGLNPDAQRLQANFSVFAASATKQDKLRGLLAKLIREPDKITRRFFEQVAALLPDSAGASARAMGESIPLARRFNQKAAVSRGWAGVDFKQLERLDQRLARISRPLPPALRQILLHPFVYNIALLFRRLAPEAGSSRAARLVRAIPFLLPSLAGERVERVHAALLMDSGEWTAGSTFDTLKPRVKRLSIEEKLTLLGSLRHRSGERHSEGPDFELPDFFEDEYEESPFRRERETRAADLAQSLLLLYRGILGDISGRQGNLPTRDRKELVRVMESVLLQDIDTILDGLENFEEIGSLLTSAIDAGCAGARLGLLTFLVGSRFRNADLRKHAEKHLDRISPPTLQDMEWLAREYSDLYYPYARSLRPLMFRYKNEKELLAVFSARLCGMMEHELLKSALRARILGLSPTLANIMGVATRSEDLGALRAQLDEMGEHEALDLPRHFLRCFRNDRLSTEGHLCWLEAQRSLRREAVWDYVLEQIKRSKTLEAGDPLDFPPSRELLRELFEEKHEALHLFMKEHLDEMAQLPTPTLEPLLDELLELSARPPADPTLLIRLEKHLAERARSGEPSIPPLMDRLRQTLQQMARPAQRKTPKARRSKS